MTRTTPKTAAEACKLLADLEAKQRDLTTTLESAAGRRKGLAVAAELGDAGAAAMLRQIAAEESQAQTSLQNLEIVVSQMKALRDELAADEATAREIETAAAVDAAVDALLKVDDEIDAALDHARELLQRRRELVREPILQQARKAKSAGALVVRDREIGFSLLAYFDRELFFAKNSESYASIVRVADWDARFFGKQSPGQIKRGPRELTGSERAMLRSVNNPAPMAGGSGFDSQVENEKFHAAGGRGRARVKDITAGWPASGA